MADAVKGTVKGRMRSALARLGSSIEHARELDSVRVEREFLVREIESNTKSLFDVPSRAGGSCSIENFEFESSR